MIIDLKNYQEYALDYIEGTLTDPALAAFEAFLAAHPAEAAGVEALLADMPRLEPDLRVTYPGKAALLRPEAETRIETLARHPSVRPWMRYAAVAAAVAVVSAVGVSIFRTTPFGDPAPQPTASVQPAMTTTSAPETAPASEATPAAPEALPATTTDPARPAPAQAAAKAAPATLAAARTAQPKIAAADPSTRARATSSPVQPTATAAPTLLPETNTRREVIERPADAPAVASNAAQTDTNAAASNVAQTPVTTADTASVPLDPITGLSTDQPLLAQAATDPGKSTVGEEIKSRGGRFLRRMVEQVITPLDELSPVTVYTSNDERVVTIASIVVSRRPYDN